jgi:FkbM family methyltransferase
MRELLKVILNYISPQLLNEIKVWNYKRNLLPKEFVQHISKLTKDDMVIDLGANIGLVSHLMAKTGATVIAFEPNINALKKLNYIGKKFNNLIIKPVAAGVRNSKCKLYLHKDLNNDEHDLTQSSTLNNKKPNVSKDKFLNIEEINFAEYLTGLNKKVELIKVDIEGYEIELINDLIDKSALDNVGMVYLETHEVTFSDLEEPTELLKKRIKNKGLESKFFYDWP